LQSATSTDGAKHVADAGGAYWLLDEIALSRRYVPAVAAEERARGGCRDGSDRRQLDHVLSGRGPYGDGHGPRARRRGCVTPDGGRAMAGDGATS
jgi:hypothetical protein